MNHTTRTVCTALKKIAHSLKAKQTPLTFLLAIGKQNHGKTAFLSQANLEQVLIASEPAATLYYNQQGVVLELSEAWLTLPQTTLTQALKQWNHCHSALKIKGVLLCLDINALFHTEPALFMSEIKSYTALLTTLGTALSYKTNLAIAFTKLDALAGFCDFYQNEHDNELHKPLGFSLHGIRDPKKLIVTYRAQFESFVEVLGQQVIHKVHPVRSTIKRSLIREFPLQLATLRVAIQALIQNISLSNFDIQTVYFSSAEQGGLSLDRLTKKIQTEYALSVPDTISQATNYRAYFIEGALQSFQEMIQQQSPIKNKIPLGPKQMTSLLVVGGLISLLVGYQYIHSAHLLHKANKELSIYDALIQHQHDADVALYHLSKASATVSQMNPPTFLSPMVQALKSQISQATQHDLMENFIPNRLHELEQVITNPQVSLYERHQALKIYLMLHEPKHFELHDVLAWFKIQWKNAPQVTIEKNVSLLIQALKQPLQPFAINPQITNDTRNFLNALPIDYLYYALMKPFLITDKESITVDGFQLHVTEIPLIFTKQGFYKTLQQFPHIIEALKKDAWVLARNDLSDLTQVLQNAYCHEYVHWWTHFLNQSSPIHAQNYQQAKSIAETLYQSHSFDHLLTLIQQNTGPELKEQDGLFNQKIAPNFTKINLISHIAIQNLSNTMEDLAKFLSTFSMVHDQGKTAFSIVRESFIGNEISNPVNALYAQSQHLPKILSHWVKQVADDTWYLLIHETRSYINQQWKVKVYDTYVNTIEHRYPFDTTQSQEVSLTDFNHFFATHGILTQFVETYIKPFLNVQDPQWQLKAVNHAIMPIDANAINELIRANIIYNMFFPNKSELCEVEFSLQKISLDPVVTHLQFMLGHDILKDTQNTEQSMAFHWPESYAKLSIVAMDGNHYELEESGPWAFFRLLQKVNVLVDEDNSANLEIHFEINGNSGRYLLKTANQINPFSPGILNAFQLSETII